MNYETRASAWARSASLRLVRQAGSQGVARDRKFNTTQKDPAASPAADLVRRNFTAAGPDQLWVSDITYVPTYAGFLFPGFGHGRLVEEDHRLVHGS